ncbi:MAG TPA: ferrochelatase [Acidimicrobiales bacterium]|nr:ferrochelatase [Acidimicrobiales bacterium]
MKPVGVLVMAHGTPRSLDELGAFYTEIRRGSPPPDDLLADLERRYRAIGGTSPLNERTRAQVDGIRRVLEQRAPGRFVVAAGAKFAPPRIADALRVLRSGGVSRVVGLVLAPHYSAASVGDYARRAREAADAPGPDEGGPLALEMIDHWYDAPGFTSLVATRVRAAVGLLPTQARAHATVLFTAHSIPTRLVDDGDPYPEQLLESATAIAQAAGIVRWSVAWQSAGRTADAWLGPDLRDVITALPASGASAVVVCPVGFVSDHLEVLYDVDIEARAVADEVGIPFALTASLNDDPEFCAVLADVVLDVVEPAHA